MNSLPDIVQALLTQDLGRVEQCLSSPGFDAGAMFPAPESIKWGPAGRRMTLLELAIVAPLDIDRKGLDPRQSLQSLSAARQARLEIIKALVGAGVSPNPTATSLSMSPLFLAISDLGAQAHDIAKVLLGAGADPNHRTLMKRTALHIAVLPNRVVDDEGLETIRLLLAHGADPNAADDAGQTPLHWAIGSNTPQSLLLLLHEHRARWDICDTSLRTPLDKLRSNNPRQADWWAVYPGFRGLKDATAPSQGATQGGPRF